MLRTKVKGNLSFTTAKAVTCIQRFMNIHQLLNKSYQIDYLFLLNDFAIIPDFNLTTLTK